MGHLCTPPRIQDRIFTRKIMARQTRCMNYSFILCQNNYHYSNNNGYVFYYLSAPYWRRSFWNWWWRVNTNRCWNIHLWVWIDRVWCNDNRSIFSVKLLQSVYNLVFSELFVPESPFQQWKCCAPDFSNNLI